MTYLYWVEYQPGMPKKYMKTKVYLFTSIFPLMMQLAHADCWVTSKKVDNAWNLSGWKISLETLTEYIKKFIQLSFNFEVKMGSIEQVTILELFHA